MSVFLEMLFQTMSSACLEDTHNQGGWSLSTGEVLEPYQQRLGLGRSKQWKGAGSGIFDVPIYFPLPINQIQISLVQDSVPSQLCLYVSKLNYNNTNHGRKE